MSGRGERGARAPRRPWRGSRPEGFTWEYRSRSGVLYRARWAADDPDPGGAWVCVLWLGSHEIATGYGASRDAAAADADAALQLHRLDR